MADFNVSYDKTCFNEGGYSNNPTDKGKETYKGISRKFFPQWRGWIIIDAAKLKLNFPKALEQNTQLQGLVKEFYKVNFWDKLSGDINPSQKIADEVFDTAVNMGLRKSGEFLQLALNVLNRQGTLYPDLNVDGGIGPKTISTLTQYLKTDTEDLLQVVLNVLQGYRYIEIMLADPTQETFARSWFERVYIIK